MSFNFIKHIHLYSILLSFIFYNIMFWHITLLRRRPHIGIQTAEHTIDTVLLISGIIVACLTYSIPFYSAQWLGFKLILMIFYIVFGWIATRSKQRSKQAYIFYGLAMFCFICVVIFAKFKSFIWPHLHYPTSF